MFDYLVYSEKIFLAIGKNLSRHWCYPAEFCLNMYRKLLIYSDGQVRKHRFLIATKLEKIFLAIGKNLSRHWCYPAEFCLNMYRKLLIYSDGQ
ncbi:MAG: hypothetical protein RSE37_22960, partial [Citrobacter sp.]